MVFRTPKCPIFEMDILLQKYGFLGVVEQYNFARSGVSNRQHVWEQAKKCRFIMRAR